MAINKDDMKQSENESKQPLDPATPEPKDFSNKHSKSLGNGRWKYQGKTFKEEPLNNA